MAEDIYSILGDLVALPRETEWVEFKHDYFKDCELGEYLSALSNSACYLGRPKGYLVFGIEDTTHAVVGTKFKPSKRKIGNEELENWLARLINPRIDFVIHEVVYNERPLVIFEIDAARDRPVSFKNIAYIRIGSLKKKLSEYPEKERKIWKRESDYDWSIEICKGADISNLDSRAIQKARSEFKKKNPRLSSEIRDWDDATFLNKAKITIEGQITNSAILLLGKEESEHFVSPSTIEITWVLRSESGLEKDYEHFGPPWLINVEKVFERIRNLKYRYLPDSTLFPVEITQYDSWVIREALHNCIAHQDYVLRNRISIVELPDELIFKNAGSFIPGSVENVIRQSGPPSIYRNHFLAQAMVNLNMIDTIGSGIKRMFESQIKRYFPLPDFDLSERERVIVRIPGKILDENYTKILLNKTDLDISTIILLDRIQKRAKISKSEHKLLKNNGLVEGRYPNIFVASNVASVVDGKAQYIKYRGFNKQYYQDLVVAFIKKHGSITRHDIDDLLYDKLPEILTEKQKRKKIENIIFEMSRKLKIIKNVGSGRYSKWVLKFGNESRKSHPK